jgi:hypothetical protein
MCSLGVSENGLSAPDGRFTGFMMIGLKSCFFLERSGRAGAPHLDLRAAFKFGRQTAPGRSWAWGQGESFNENIKHFHIFFCVSVTVFRDAQL